MSSPLEILDQQDAKRAEELKKLAQTPCYDHTQCGEDCIPDCPHYAERRPDEKAKPAHKYGLQISEPNKRLWVGEIGAGIVTKTLYTDTWGGNRMAGTREKAIENAKLIVNALNTFNGSVDALYCHDLEQRIELLEMQLVEVKDKAEAYDRIMIGGKKTLKEWANIFNRPMVVTQSRLIALACRNIPEIRTTKQLKHEYSDWIDPKDLYGEYVFFIPIEYIDFSGDWKDSITLPDGWEA